MQQEQDLTQRRRQDLEIRQLELRLELLAITEELDRRDRAQNPRGKVLSPRALDHEENEIHIGDKVRLRTRSVKGSSFARETEAIVVGWNNRRTDIVIRKVIDDGDTTTRRPYNLIVVRP